MLEDKRIAYAVLAIGIVLVLLSVLIDPIRGNDIYMATSQIVVLIVGLVVAVAGAYLAFMRRPAA